MVRVGQGLDFHKLVRGRNLILGGVLISHEKGLDGHSDADVLTHAVMDALLGAVGLGDIGMHFPDTSQDFKDANSLELLEKVCRMIREKGFEIANVDATVVAQEPKLHPYRKDIKSNLAKAMGVPEDRINLKATTTEKLGFIGRKEGIASSATALLFDQS